MRRTSQTPLWNLVGVKHVAEKLGIHEATVYRMANRGQIPAVKLGGQWRFRSDLVTNWLEKEMFRQQEARKQWHPKHWQHESYLPR